VDLPGRPAGNVDHLRRGAGAWEHLAWEIWNIERQLDRQVRTLLEGWAGPGAEAFERRWTEARQGFPQLDHQLHTVADRLRVIAFTIQDGQEEYDQTLAEAGLVGVAGVALTVLTVGGSDLVAAEADAALVASLAGRLTELGVSVSRLATLLSEVVEGLGRVASRFAMDLAIRGPEFASSPAGGAATGVGLALASGVRDPGDLAASGLSGAAENIVGSRRAAHEAGDESPASAPVGRSYAGPRRPAAGTFTRFLSEPPPSDGEAVWREITTLDGGLVGERRPGARPSVRQVSDDLAAARAYFDHLANEGRDVTKPGTDRMVQLRDGTVIAFRAQSKSGPPTIDINIAGRGHFKFKFVGPAGVRGEAR
jgi:uncharacterized protein YukE